MCGERKPERPILAVSFRHRGAEIIVKCMDELHLEEVCKAVCNGENPLVDCVPEVILLETIRAAAEAEGKYLRQTGGSGNYGHVKIRIDPIERGSGFEFLNGMQNGAVPDEYVAPIEEGIREATQSGVLFGYEVVDIRATLLDGSYHHLDSNPTAFRIAASIAFKEAARKAHPVLLEPVMSVEAVVPEEYLGTVISDIHQRRGRIESIEHRADSVAIHAHVPLSEVLLSSPLGRPEYAMRFARYEQARRPRDEFGDHDPGVTANKPIQPKPRSGLAAATPDQESE